MLLVFRLCHKFWFLGNFDWTFLLLQGTPKLTFDTNTGLAVKIETPGVSITKDFEQNFFYYVSAAGNNDDSGMNRSSGAYIFRPNSTLIPINQQPTVKHYKGTDLWFVVEVENVLTFFSLLHSSSPAQRYLTQLGYDVEPAWSTLLSLSFFVFIILVIWFALFFLI